MDGARLSWQTACETNDAGFAVETRPVETRPGASLQPEWQRTVQLCNAQPSTPSNTAIRLLKAVNLEQGYKPLQIYSPREVPYYEEGEEL